MITRELAVGAAPDLDVDVKSAPVTIDRGASGAVIVHVDTNHPDHWRVSQSGDSIVVREEGGGFRVRRSGARVRITVPDGTATRVTTASGDVTVLVTTGRTSIATASGDVRIGVASSLSVKSASGDVVIDRVVGDAELKSASGDLTAATVGGDLQTTTASGDLRVDTISGNARIATASGDIRIARFEGTSFVVNTVSGDVSVGVPSGRSVDLDVNTLSGDVSLPERRADAAPADPDQPKLHLTMRVKSVSGDFRLARA